MGKQWKQWQTIFLGSKITADSDCSNEMSLWKKSYDQPRQHSKKKRHYFTDKGSSSQRYVFSNSHLWVWELDHKESWALKSWCCWPVVLEKSLECPLDCKEIQPVNRKEISPEYSFIGRTDVEAEILWPPDAKNWLIRKDPDNRKPGANTLLLDLRGLHF